jgi:hypothetical protein
VLRVLGVVPQVWYRVYVKGQKEGLLVVETGTKEVVAMRLRVEEGMVEMEEVEKGVKYDPREGSKVVVRKIDSEVGEEEVRKRV